jgi:hypothetical protein
VAAVLSVNRDVLGSMPSRGSLFAAIELWRAPVDAKVRRG